MTQVHSAFKPSQILIQWHKFELAHYYSDGIVRELHPASLLRPTSPNDNMQL